MFIYDLLKEAKINVDTQGSRLIDIDRALKTASKNQLGNEGYPEFVAVVKDYVLVMEDKKDRRFHS